VALLPVVGAFDWAMADGGIGGGAAATTAANVLRHAFSCAEHNVSYAHRVDNPGVALVWLYMRFLQALPQHV